MTGRYKRRRVLAGGATALSVLVSGCLQTVRGVCDDPGGEEPSEQSESQPETASLPVSDEELTRSTDRDAIPAITDPAFGPDWEGIELTGEWWGTGEEFSFTIELSDDDPIIGIQREGDARAYPLKILNWHEVVNDDFGGPLLVTYCPLCGSGITAERLAQGEPTLFGVSGFLYRSNLVMYDQATESLWGQIAAKAIQGPLTGTELSLVPSQFTTWSAWKREHPDTEVLLPAPLSETVGESAAKPYMRNPYAGYESSNQTGVEGTPNREGDLHPKTTVLGIVADGEAKAYPLPAVRTAGAVNDVVGDLPVVVTVRSGDRLVAYHRRVSDDLIEFSRTPDNLLAGAETTWKPETGAGIEGPLSDTTLKRVDSAVHSFWFAWQQHHPGTDRYRPDGGSTVLRECFSG